MKNILKNKIFYLLLAILLTLPAVWPIFQTGFFTFHDETQIANLHQFIKVLDLGQFPPRWAPDMFFTYGSPYPEFNYQLPYYVGYVINHLGFGLVDTYKILLALSLFIGAIGMYILGVTYTSLPFALAASVLYTYTPYRAVDVYVRGTIGEAFALALFPYLMLSFLRIIKNSRLSNVIIAAFLTGLLVITHQLASLLVLPALFLIVFFAVLRTRNYITAKRLLLVPFIAILLSAYYLLPTLFEQKFIQPVAPFNFYDNFPFIKQLIYSPWGYGSSHWGPDDQMSFQIGYLNLFIVLASPLLLLIPRLWTKDNTHTRTLSLLTLAFFFLGVFLMNQRSTPLWQLFPLTTSVQFPWRILMLETFLTSFLFLCLSRLKIVSIRPVIALSVIVLSFIFNLNYFNVGDRFDRNDSYFLRAYLPNQVLLPGEIVSKEYLDYTENYYPLPTNAVKPKEMPKSKIESNIPTAQFDIKDANPLNYLAFIDTPETATVTFNTFYYPGWKVEVDSLETPVSLNKYGALVFVVPAGSHFLRIHYADTPIRRYSNYLSLASISLASIYLLSFLAKLRKNGA